MKAYTDLEQSKKLAEILPIESADMPYYYDRDNDVEIPCWSLAALLGIIPEPVLTYIDENNWNVSTFEDNRFKDEVISSNPVDACYEMILKLHEQKLL